MDQFIDLSHVIVSGQQTYPGLPAPLLTDYMSHESSQLHYSKGTEFHIGKLTMVLNSGTYVDSPFHRYANQVDIAGLDLSRLANLDAICVKTNSPRITSADLRNLDVDLAAKAVLFCTGWSRHWGSAEYFSGHPFLTAEAAQVLVSNGVHHVGIDSLNIDDTNDKERPAHSILLASGIPITEHLTNLESLPKAGFRYFATPVKVAGAGSFPVRAFAIVASR